MRDGLINGYPNWLKTDRSKAFWFDKASSAWLVGKNEDLGSNTGYISGPSGKDSYPNEIKQGWKYVTDPDDPWADANPSEIIFKAIGRSF